MQSHRHADSISQLFQGDRFTLTLRHGRLELFARPAATPGAAPLRNEQIEWYMHWLPGGLFSAGRTAFITFAATDAAVMTSSSRDVEQPETFIPAHLALAYGPITTDRPGPFENDQIHLRLALRLEASGLVKIENARDGTCIANVDGLRVVLRPTSKKGTYFGTGRRQYSIYATSAEIDPAQLPAIREQWRRRLDVRVASIHCGILALVALAPSTVHGIVLLVRAARIRSRRLHNLCTQCGYDLRASTDRCPECGKPIRAIVTSPSSPSPPLRGLSGPRPGRPNS